MNYTEKLRLIKLGQLPKEAVAKEKKPLNKIGAKKRAELEEKKISGDSALDLWFEARRKEMSGLCELCGGKTCRDDDDLYRRSIHHILDKRPAMFPSVALHEDNWMEVCFWGNSCHTNIHNGTITWELLHDSLEWKVIVDKFKKIYPFIKEEEKKNLPTLLLNELNIEGL